MPNQPTSFRFPFNIPDDVHPSVKESLRVTYNGVLDLNQAIRALNDKVKANSGTIQNITENITASPGGSPAPAPPALFASISVTIPTAAVLTLKALPVQLLAAPGVGSMYVPVSVIYQYKFATTPYTIDGTFDQYLCVFDGTQPTVANVRNAFASILADGFMDQAASQVYVAPGLARGAQTIYDNGALSVGLPSDCTAELTTGDGSLIITAEYAVVTLS